MKKRIALVAGFMLAATGLMQAINPYLPLWEFIPDGEPYVFEDPDHPGQYRVYIYGSHDNLVTEYCGRDQVVWSAPIDDLNNWRYDGIIFESKYDALGHELNAGGIGDVLYAPDVVETRDAHGRKVYYLYPNNQSGTRNSQVAKSYRPDGPFIACNWSKDDPSAANGVLRFDPGVFVDDDGRVYGYWGFEHSYAAELDPLTMTTVKPGEKIYEDFIPSRFDDSEYRFFEASSMRKIKDKYVFIYSRWTKDGEAGLPESNYTLAYCYSNSPLGPMTYGGTIIDGRAKEPRKGGKTVATATPFGNTHGSICEINGQWYVFYHRQAGTNEYSRQAMVAPLEIEVKEGADGFVRIKEAEYTCEGFELGGLDPLKTYPAGIACYYTGPTPAQHSYPDVKYSGSHTEIVRNQYDGRKSVYDLDINRCPMVNNTDGSVVGYKYFNFDKTFGHASVELLLDYIPAGISGKIDVYLDRPTKAMGGKMIGSLKVDANAPTSLQQATIALKGLTKEKGKHALFFVFSSPIKGQSICTIERFGMK